VEYYPMMVRMAGKQCLVVGGGPIAERKIRSLLSAKAIVKVVTQTSTDQIEQWAREGLITLIHRSFQSPDVDGASLVIAATNVSTVNLQVYHSIQPHQWINIVDRPDLCTFIVPALVERGDLILTVSTSGQSPSFAKKMKTKLDAWLSDEYGEYLEFLGMARKKILSLELDPVGKAEIMARLVDDRFFEQVKTGEWDQVLTELLQELD
jgi:precorrin-2 dehydrogenase / sirohydrochlorin ferrochelatase